MQKLLIALVIGFIWYVVFESWRNALWLLVYLIGLGLLSYFGAFGGKNIISFGLDFVIIGCFSLIVFWLAVGKQSQ